MKASASAALVAASMLVAVGCGEPPQAIEGIPPDLLFLRASDGVAVFEAGADVAKFSGPATVTSSDWSTAIETTYVSGNTRVTGVDPSTAAERWRTELDGRFDAKLVSEDGDLAALGPRGEVPYRLGRSSTQLVIAGSGMVEPRTINLDGNYEPEAFSTDGASLFVIKYLPARNPSKYQVRRLDIEEGRVRGVYTPHDELQEAMGGTARIQAASPDGRRLYTLYTVGGGRNGSSYAFIHVLALDEIWAHCIALPPDFAVAAERSSAITVSPDGDRVYVANSRTSKVAEIDTEHLTVARTGNVAFSGDGRPQAAHDSGSTFYFGSGKSLTSVDTADLTQKGAWRVPGKISGIQAAADGKKVYVGMRREVAVLDAASGERLEVVNPPGVRTIEQLGAGMRSLDQDDEIPKDFSCAC